MLRLLDGGWDRAERALVLLWVCLGQSLCHRFEEEGRRRGDELAASGSKTHITAPPPSTMDEDLDDSKGAGKKGKKVKRLHHVVVRERARIGHC